MKGDKNISKGHFSLMTMVMLGALFFTANQSSADVADNHNESNQSAIETITDIKIEVDQTRAQIDEAKAALNDVKAKLEMVKEQSEPMVDPLTDLATLTEED